MFEREVGRCGAVTYNALGLRRHECPLSAATDIVIFIDNANLPVAVWVITFSGLSVVLIDDHQASIKMPKISDTAQHQSEQVHLI